MTIVAEEEYLSRYRGIYFDQRLEGPDGPIDADSLPAAIIQQVVAVSGPRTRKIDLAGQVSPAPTFRMAEKRQTLLLGELDQGTGETILERGKSGEIEVRLVVGRKEVESDPALLRFKPTTHNLHGMAPRKPDSPITNRQLAETVRKLESLAGAGTRSEILAAKWKIESLLTQAVLTGRRKRGPKDPCPEIPF